MHEIIQIFAPTLAAARTHPQHTHTARPWHGRGRPSVESEVRELVVAAAAQVLEPRRRVRGAFGARDSFGMVSVVVVDHHNK